MANIPPVLIPAPPAPPRPYGLFDVALGPMPMPRVEAEAGGVIYVPDVCESDVQLYAINCPAVSGSKEFAGIETAVSGAAFAAITSYTCASHGFSFEEAQQRVLTRMQLREQRAVERRLWQGQGLDGLGAITGLLRDATDLGTAACTTEAVEMLEQALADNGVAGGLIHARPGMVSHLANAHLLRDGNGRQFTTRLGTPIAFGQGYDGTGPAGEATSTSDEYMYASGRVLIWAGDTQVPPPRQTFDRATNQMYLLAEKTFVTLIECGTWAVKVTRTCTTAGQA